MMQLHCDSGKKFTSLYRYNFDIRESILITFGRNITEKVSNQSILYFLTSPK